MMPTNEQKNMCHMVSVMGYGKPEKASSLFVLLFGGGGERRVRDWRMVTGGVGVLLGV